MHLAGSVQPDTGPWAALWVPLASTGLGQVVPPPGWPASASAPWSPGRCDYGLRTGILPAFSSVPARSVLWLCDVRRGPWSPSCRLREQGCPSTAAQSAGPGDVPSGSQGRPTPSSPSDWEGASPGSRCLWGVLKSAPPVPEKSALQILFPAPLLALPTPSVWSRASGSPNQLADTPAEIFAGWQMSTHRLHVPPSPRGRAVLTPCGAGLHLPHHQQTVVPPAQSFSSLALPPDKCLSLPQGCPAPPSQSQQPAPICCPFHV